MFSHVLVEHIAVGFNGMVVNLITFNQNMNQVIAAGGTIDVGQILAMCLWDLADSNSPRSVPQI